VFTSSPLYLQAGDYFSLEEFVAVDGTFEVDGQMGCSHKNPGNDWNEQVFNVAWHEVRTGVKNFYQGMGVSFPLTGNNKQKLPYSENGLILAINDAVRLHNIIMNIENLLHSMISCCFSYF
jgi:hypothetical protein